MHLALYRSERPERFGEIIGQKHIVKILQNQLKTGSVSQSYLFTGTRGTGKTTTARILAKAVNCIGDPADGQIPCGECENCKAIREGRFMDVIELDAASNNGVEDLRAIIDSVQYPPTLGKYKVYIIDEVHMLSQAAENAFLKTLEEPPEYAIFILATTNPEKVRATIRSRCMTLNFRRVSELELVDGMRAICQKKGVNMTDDALAVVAQRADGSVRDGLSILEQCISGGDELVDVDLVLDYIGSAGLSFYLDLTQSVLTQDRSAALTAVGSMIRQGKDAKQMLADWLAHYRDLMVVKYVKDLTGIVNASPENIDRLRAQAENFDASTLETSIRMLSEYLNLGRYSTQPRILLETAVLHLMTGESHVGGSMLQAAPAASYASAPSAGRTAAPAPQRPVQPAPAPRPAAASASAARPVQSPAPQQQRPAAARPATPPAQPARPAAAPQKPAAPAGPTSNAGVMQDYNKMWEQIVDIVADANFSFRVIVGAHSYIESYRNGEIVLKVKKNKLTLAELNKTEIDAAAKQLFGPDTFVSIREDDRNSRGAAAPRPASTVGTPAAAPLVQQPKPQAPAQAAPPTPAPKSVNAADAVMDIGYVDSFGDEGDEVIVPSDYNMGYDEDYSFGEDDDITELAENASALLGIDVEIVDK